MSSSPTWRHSGWGWGQMTTPHTVCLLLIPITGASPALPLRRASAQCWLPPSPSLPHSPISEGNLGETKVPEAQLKKKARVAQFCPQKGVCTSPLLRFPFHQRLHMIPGPGFSQRTGISPHTVNGVLSPLYQHKEVTTVRRELSERRH